MCIKIPFYTRVKNYDKSVFREQDGFQFDDDVEYEIKAFSYAPINVNINVEKMPSSSNKYFGIGYTADVTVHVSRDALNILAEKCLQIAMR